MARPGEALVEHRVPLVVGSDCSGMCTESHALDALGIAHTHAFCSEVWEPAIRCIRAMAHRPKIVYRDVTERSVADVPEVDLYVCGFPCQPNSAMNVKKSDNDVRRDPMAKALEYIQVKRPKYFVLENVVGIMHVSKGAVWRALVDALDALDGYAWDYRILDPCKHANSPQSRPRVYLCGKRDATTPIEWPTEVPLSKRAVDLLDPSAKGQQAAPCYLKMLETWGIAPDAPGIVEFCAASRAHSPYKKGRVEPLTASKVKHVLRADVAPCLIKHDPGPYANHLRRHLTANECLLLQGFDPSKVRRPQVTPLQMRQLCGNAMHCGVLAEVLAALLDESG
jgi:site-specific DNA-cytosine methylase